MLAGVLLLVLAAVAPSAGCAAEDGADASPAAPSWDRPQSIKRAAERIALLHRVKGPKGAYAFIDACYRTHSLASSYGEGLETCLVQDYLETKMLIEISARMPPEALAQLGAATPDALNAAMSRRIEAAMKQYGLPASHGDELRKLTDQHGAPVFLAVVFPEALREHQKNLEKKKQEKK